VRANPLTLREKERICDALLRVGSMQDPVLRNACVAQLQDRLGHSVMVQRYADPRHDIWSVLTTCEARDDALPIFVNIVREIHNESTATIELDRIVREIGQDAPAPAADVPAIDSRQLARQQREALSDLVAGVPIRHLGDTYQAVFAPATPVEQHIWLDAGDAISQVENAARANQDATAATGSLSGLTAILIFTDRLAHAVGGPPSLDMHRWIDAVGTSQGYGQSDIRKLCVGARAAELTAGTVEAIAGSIELPSAEEAITRVLPQHDDVNPGNLPQINFIPGDVVISAPVLHHPIVEQPDSVRLIWGGVPIRNPSFTGRERQLAELREGLLLRSAASVLPQALHGLGGVGKTQLAIEYVYKYVSDYQLVWWISADDPALVRKSLADLGGRLGLPASDDIQQAATTVLNALGASPLRWIIVYDNADEPAALEPLLPSARGHVIVTSRNREWAHVRSGHSIEVDVFERDESIELLTKRSSGIAPAEADELAEKLGDLPLAIEQAAMWREATGMPVREYLDLFDEHSRELLSEGKPAAYATTVYAYLRVAVDRLRSEAPAALELLELFAFLGAEPLSTTLLRSGRNSDLSPALSSALRDPIALGRGLRDLGRYGLAKVDPSGQKIQVHRLVQHVLREDLRAEQREQGRTNIQAILAAANPHEPLEPRHWPLYAEIGPHIVPAGMIDAPDIEARRLVLDQTRYFYAIGDYESSRQLAEAALKSWAMPEEEGGLGPNHELTLVMTRRLAGSLGMLGDNDRAQQLDEDTFARLRRHPDFGEDHEHTLQQANSVARDLRVAGQFREALRTDEENLKRHLRVFGPDVQQTLDTRNNLAVNLRMLGDFQSAHDIDQMVAAKWEETLGKSDSRTLFSISNLARDLYGLGRYPEALELQRQTLPLMIQQLGDRHTNVLLATRTVVMAMRKMGQYDESARRARDSYLNHHARFGPNHEYTLAATNTLANCLRAVGKFSEALAMAEEAVLRYTNTFGTRHPLTLAGRVNLTIILRAIGEHRRALALDEETVTMADTVLGSSHPYALCAASGLTTDLVLHHKLADAQAASQRTLTTSYEVRGPRHPYTLAAGVNAAFDMQAIGDETDGQQLFDEMVTALGEVLGADHPEVLDATRGKRTESDIEAPPT
jgi:tetratricopeptide (TPR) repeat protein